MGNHALSLHTLSLRSGKLLLERTERVVHLNGTCAIKKHDSKEI
jgi:hypothetical protein